MSMISRQVAELREWSEHENLVEGNRTMADLLFKAADTIEMLSEKARGQAWIPCEKGLPEKDGFYLTTITSGGQIAMCKLLFVKPKWIIRNWLSGEVIAWMPLPKPYMKGIDDEEVDVL